MKSNQLTLAFILFMICVLLSFESKAQKSTAQLEIATEYLRKNDTKIGLQASDYAEMQLKSSYKDQHNGLSHIYLAQTVSGIPVDGAILGLHFKNPTQMVFVANRFVKRLNERINTTTPVWSASKALLKAAETLELALPKAPAILKRTDVPQQLTTFEAGALALEPMKAELVYLPDADGNLRLSWQIHIYPKHAQNYWLIGVDATDGKILTHKDLVISCNFDHSAFENCAENLPAHTHTASTSFIKDAFEEELPVAGNFYRVYDAPVETPNHGNRSLVYTNGDPVASPYGWHNDGTLPYLITKGNNVYAYEDQLGANVGTPAVGGFNPFQPLNFDFPLDLADHPHDYKNAAITNLFYWNNYVHDVLYHYGFTEPAGNFQTDNLGKGGLGNDAVMAEAQDGGGTNNANFLTLPDGVPGRMQMYLWSSTSTAELVHIESSPTFPAGGVSFEAIQSAFGPEIDQTGVTAELVLVESSQFAQIGCSSCGCGTNQGVGLPPNNDVTGKIVLIDRGDCSFIEKIMGAQMGGAAGVIVANNLPGAGPIAMGGDETGATILIPSVMVRYEDGLMLKGELTAGAVQIALRRDVPASPMKDGDLDNGIIAHEYGHGVSTRLTGGPSSSCLSGDEQAGEGWSDFFALMLTMSPAQVADAGQQGRGIGTYVFDESTSGNGIRPTRYSTDLSVNPYTYGDINNSEILVPHGVGFIFCTALFDMTWNLINAHGYDTDVVHGNGGNNLALQLVMDGLKLQPCSPTFLDSRDAILAADMALTGGANQCLIWEAFAKRGMGFSAVSGTNTRGDEIEAFDLPPICGDQLLMQKTADRSLAANGEVITYTLSVTNTGLEMVNGIVVSDNLPNGLSYVSGSASNGGSFQNGTVNFPVFSLGAGMTATRTFQASLNSVPTQAISFYDDLEDGINNWTATPGLNSWTITNTESHSGNFAWFAADPDNLSNQILSVAEGQTLPNSAELRFWHKFNTEAGFDGGVVELSNDGGITWYDLGPQMTQNGYTDIIPLANNPAINGFAFGGSSGGWVETVINLGIFANQTVNIRFRFSSDVLSPGVGWWVDDVLIARGAQYLMNTAQASNSETTVSAAASILVAPAGFTALQQNEGRTNMPANNLETALNSDIPTLSSVQIYPNPASNLVNVQFDQFEDEVLQISLLNMHGQQLKSFTYNPIANNNFLQLEVADFPEGVYLLSIRSNTEVQSFKLQVLKP